MKRLNTIGLVALALSGCASMSPSRAPNEAGSGQENADIVRSNPAEVAAPVGAYTHLAIVPGNSELLVLAGQVGVDATGTLPTDVEGQLRNALANARTILRSAGAGPAQVIKVNIWLTEALPRERFVELWKEFHEGTPPPTTLAYVARLSRPEYRVEVEVWAARTPR
jgi:enamine deaminase RidA (YjgF/YER057c/UK114 family)